jgi:hypothetical protein
MKIYKFRQDGVFDEVVEMSIQESDPIPLYHTRSAPPEVPEGFYLIMRDGWKLVQGPKPELADSATEQDLVDFAKNYLDNFARTRNYDNIMSLISYAQSMNPQFQAEAEYGVVARDLVWAKVIETINSSVENQKPLPSLAVFQAEMPQLVWPS